MRIDIWSDVVCPWCYIGKRRFDRALAQLDERSPGSCDQIDIVYRAYQLDPTAKLGTPTPVSDVYARKFGGPERAAAIFEHLTTTAAADDIAFDFSRALRANTILSHRLLWWVHRVSGYPSQSILKEALMAGYFSHGRDLGDIESLVDIASAALEGSGRSEFGPPQLRAFLESDSGVAEVRADLDDASSAGITGVPTYVIDGQWAIPGAQDTDTFVRVLQRSLERRSTPST